jgi:ribose transport system ATP-binding protein
MQASPPPLIAMRDIGKSFGPTRVLGGVTLELRAGEVHALAGENGAGKSTLIRILSGVYSNYEGSIAIDGRPARFASPRDATRAGIATIHQELSLVGPMSVADNLFLGEGGALLSREPERRRIAEAERWLKELELDVDPKELVERLPLSVRQLVEIARALRARARMIVMDEPTSALNEAEAARLFEHVERLRREKKGIVYISHRMEEIFRIADRVSVLRDGALVGTWRASELGERELVQSMVGRELAAEPPSLPSPSSETVFSGELSVGDPLRPERRLVDRARFSLKKGELVGLAGLEGSGASELLLGLFGALPSVAGRRLELDGAPYRVESPARSIAQGVVLLTKDRKTSVVGELGSLQNATLSSLARVTRRGFVDARRERELVSATVRRLELSAPSLDAPARKLSGGNQQKVALARCLLAEPKLLLMDDPTRGVDVGAKADIYALMRDLAERGVSILFASSELAELLSLSHRILVLFRGRVVLELGRDEATRDRIVLAAMGGASEAA